MANLSTRDPELLNYVQAARILNVHPDTVRRYWKQGKLKMTRLPGTEKKLGMVRFKLEDVEAMLKQPATEDEAEPDPTPTDHETQTTR